MKVPRSARQDPLEALGLGQSPSQQRHTASVLAEEDQFETQSNVSMVSHQDMMGIHIPDPLRAQQSAYNSKSLSNLLNQTNRERASAPFQRADDPFSPPRQT